ncbi:AmpG family muropeptide MFS transporter [Thiohalomonas denitrificans]|uniref:AmpG family muropeptide MFS transporter n=1 Tax=Thiohalomonas denitrificans TaxID=415747 RepID=UPI0026EAEB69|nr:AmpG family muropeptide MFS transporter [Thiohalomonas denitrificans]
MSNTTTGFREGFRLYRHPRVVTMLFLGFSSGLPLLLVFGTLSFWLREAGVERGTIGFISWAALAYGFKWAWAPLVDRLPLPLLTRVLGRRRAWLLASQVTVVMALLGMAFSDPSSNLAQLVMLAVLTAFASATQDIAVDAFRIESAPQRVQAAMASTYMIGYRLAMISASAGVLWVAAWFDPDEASYHHLPWLLAYSAMAGLMGIGILTTLIVREPDVAVDAATMAREEEGALTLRGWRSLPQRLERAIEWLWRAVISPLADFLRRYRWHALLLLALIATYRISDIVLGVVANIFYVDMGFTKAEVANVTKVFGIAMTLLGAVLGGVLVGRFGVMRILFIGALLAAATNLLFALLATVGHDLPMLIVVVGMDNLSGGLASAAFVAYLSGLTNISYSATQYALFSSLMMLLPKFVGGFSGTAVDAFSYPEFFVATALMGLPVLLLVWLAGRFVPAEESVRD